MPIDRALETFEAQGLGIFHHSKLLALTLKVSYGIIDSLDRALETFEVQGLFYDVSATQTSQLHHQEVFKVTDKLFKTHNQQLKILREKGLSVPKDGRPKRCLEKHNYYNVVNGYKDLFLDSNSGTSTETYLAGASFFELKALYDFDCELRMILLKRILRVENYIKSEIAYEFSRKYGHDNYMKMSNFDLVQGDTKKLQKIIDLIKQIQSDIAQQVGKHDAIRHYMTQYGYVPLWVLVNILSLGRISKFYSLMKQADRQSVARKYNISDKDLMIILKLLTHYRNKCAHDERVYNFKTNRVEIKNTIYHDRLNIPKRGSKYICGKNDVFALIISLKLLVDNRSFKRMISELRTNIRDLEKDLNVITIDDVLSEMGFPSNWEEIKNC